MRDGSADPYPVSPDFKGDVNGNGKLEYCEAHPEWYGLINGMRDFDIRDAFGVNYCTANEDATRELLRGVVGALIGGEEGKRYAPQLAVAEKKPWEDGPLGTRGIDQLLGPRLRQVVRVRPLQSPRHPHRPQPAPDPPAPHGDGKGDESGPAQAQRPDRLPGLRRRGRSAHPPASRRVRLRKLHRHLFPHRPLLRPPFRRLRLHRDQRPLFQSLPQLGPGPRALLPRARSSSANTTTSPASRGCRSCLPRA